MIKALVLSIIISSFPIYQIRLLREHIQSKFVFGDEDTAYWHLTIAQKRIKDGHPAAAKVHKLQAQGYISQLKDKTDINYLVDLLESLDTGSVR